jgi:hypothetical protein
MATRLRDFSATLGPDSQRRRAGAPVVGGYVPAPSKPGSILAALERLEAELGDDGEVLFEGGDGSRAPADRLLPP